MNATGAAVVTEESRSQDRAFSFATAAIVWVMIIIMSVPGNLDFFWTGIVQGGDANPVTRTLWISLFAIATGIVLLRTSMTLRVLRQVNVFFLLFIALATVSLAWSIDREQTGVRLFRMMVMCSVFLAVAVAGCDTRRFQELIRPPITLL